MFSIAGTWIQIFVVYCPKFVTTGGVFLAGKNLALPSDNWISFWLQQRIYCFLCRTWINTFVGLLIFRLCYGLLMSTINEIWTYYTHILFTLLKFHRQFINYPVTSTIISIKVAPIYCQEFKEVVQNDVKQNYYLLFTKLWRLLGWFC